MFSQWEKKVLKTAKEQINSDSDKQIVRRDVNIENKLENLIQISRNTAHKLNNMVTTILANAQLMSLIVEDEELKDYLKSIENAASDAGVTVREFQLTVRSFSDITFRKK
jgi:signal transduction histidine kinase